MRCLRIRRLGTCLIQYREVGTLRINQMILSYIHNYLAKMKLLIHKFHLCRRFLSHVLGKLWILSRFQLFHSHRHFFIYKCFLMCLTLYFWSFLYNNSFLLSSRIHFEHLSLWNQFISMNFFISYSVIINSWSNSVLSIIENFFCNRYNYHLNIFND